MSLCLTIMDKNNIYMGADSATSTIIGDEIVRVNTNARKIFDINNYILFCCGKVENIESILKYVKENGLNNIEDYLRSICKNDCEVFEAEVLAYDKTKKILCTFSQYNGFNKIEYHHPKDGIQILTSGYKTKEAFEIARDCIQNGKEVFDIFKDTYTKLICNGIGGNVVIYSNVTHMRMFPLIDDTRCMNIQGLEEYFVNAEVLCGQLVLGNKLVARSDDGVVNISGNLISIYDKNGKKIVDLGEYANDTYGLMLYDESGNVLIGKEGLLNTWQDTVQENVDNIHPLVLRVFIPENTKSIYKAYVRFTLENFRAYSKSAKSVGSRTYTSSSGGGDVVTTDEGGRIYDSTEDGGGEYITATTDTQYEEGADSRGHDHGLDSGVQLAIYGGQAKLDNGTYVIERNSGQPYVTWRKSGYHTHPVDFRIDPHSHRIRVDGHSHRVHIDDHEHDIYIEGHSHEIEYGIYEGSKASRVYLHVNNTLVGGAYNSNVDAIDITPFLYTGVWNTIVLTSNTLGRINASVFVQALMGAYR